MSGLNPDTEGVDAGARIFRIHKATLRQSAQPGPAGGRDGPARDPLVVTGPKQ
jgi:hypothetical protein